MKKFLLTTLISIAFILIFTVLVNAGTYGDLTYSVSNGEVTITGGSYNATEVTIPSTIDGYPVVAIGEDAFEWCEKLVTITIPASVRSIGWYAFHTCYGLRNVIFEEGSQCTLICGKAFSHCTGLRYLVIPESVTDIGWQAFDVCKNLRIYGKLGSYAESYAKSASIPFEEYVDTSMLTYTISDGKVTITGCDTSAVSVIIPATIKGYPVTAIGQKAFKSCENLTTVLFNENSQLKTIGNSAFWGCKKLNSIIIPKSVTSISNYAFSFCENLASVTFVESSKCESVGEYAFQNCINLKTVTFEEFSKLTSIGQYAFYNCTGLVCITFPDNVTNISASAFEGCSDFTSCGKIDSTDITWVIDAGGVLTVSGTDTMPNYANSASNRAPWYNERAKVTSIVVEEGITSIGNFAFHNCTNATKITLPKSLTTLTGASFIRGTKITEVDLSNVVVMTKNIFASATSVERVIFSESFKDARGNIFGGNTLNITVVAPEDSYAYKYVDFFATKYAGQANLTAEANGVAECPVHVMGSMGDSVIYTFYKMGTDSKGNDINWMVISGEGAVRSYWYISDARIEMDKAEGGNNFAPTYYMYEDTVNGRPILRNTKKLQVLEGITEIGNYSFYRCLKAQEVEILGPITRVGNAAFQACEAIRKIELPNTVTAIGKNAFNGCRYLRTMTIPNSVTSIGETIFKNADLEPDETRPSESSTLTITTTNKTFINYIEKNYPTSTHKVVIK